MNIPLSSKIQQFIREKVDRGEYGSPDGVVGEALLPSKIATGT